MIVIGDSVMKKWFTAALFTVLAFMAGGYCGQAFSHVNPDYDTFGDDDVLPWPWGTECPFPWDDIEGVWKASKPAASSEGEKFKGPGILLNTYYEFEVTNMSTYETKLVQITKFNEKGQVIGTGRGYSHPHQKIVRAVIVAAQGVNMANHRVIVRAYKQNTTLSCGSELVTVLTTRSMTNKTSSDRHYVLKKVPLDL